MGALRYLVHGNLVHGKRLFLILRPNTVRYVIFVVHLRRVGVSISFGAMDASRDCERKDAPFGPATTERKDARLRSQRQFLRIPPATSQKTLAIHWACNALPKRRAPASQKIGLLRWSKDAHPSSVAPALLCFDWHAQRLRRDCGTTAGRITSCAANAARKRLRRDCGT